MNIVKDHIYPCTDFFSSRTWHVHGFFQVWEKHIYGQRCFEHVQKLLYASNELEYIVQCRNLGTNRDLPLNFSLFGASVIATFHLTTR